MSDKTKPLEYEDCPSCAGRGFGMGISTSNRVVFWDPCEDCAGEGQIEVTP